MSASAKIKILAKNISRIALVSEEATKYLAKQFNFTRDEITFGLPLADVRGTGLGEACPIKVARKHISCLLIDVSRNHIALE